VTGSRRAATEVVRWLATPAASELLIAELYSLGTLGVEERAHVRGVELHAYFELDTLAQAQLQAMARMDGVELLERSRVPERDWELAWREGLAPRRVGRLWIRPSWCESQGSPELVIDPKQAFGSGEHATTRLSLGLLGQELRAGDRVLDAGAGSGILGLGALRLGAAAALGFDIDPVACLNAAENRQSNGLPLLLFCGTLDALDPGARWDIVVANMLLARLAPGLERLQAHARRALILSGFLREQRDELDALLDLANWRTVREIEEAQSGDLWCARLLHRVRQS
jgi:ribosomal protein L11 methyltransferase